MSVYTGPDTVEPSPYSIVKDPGCSSDELEAAALYLCLNAQGASVHEADGTQRSDDPAANSVNVIKLERR